MAYSNINWVGITDDEAVQRIGQEIKRMRLEKDLTQAHVAAHAGIDRTTVSQLENGRPASILIVVQVLRAIGRLDVLDHFHEDPRPTPMMLMEEAAKYERKKRKRASSKQPPIKPPKPKSSW